MTEIALKVTPWNLSICKLTMPGIPVWAGNSRFLNYALTGEEISLVCESEYVPDGIKTEKNWRCMKVDGILDFSLIGIIANITTLLAQHKISVFVISTYDTDYILLRDAMLSPAISALEAAGYNLIT